MGTQKHASAYSQRHSHSDHVVNMSTRAGKCCSKLCAVASCCCCCCYLFGEIQQHVDTGSTTTTTTVVVTTGKEHDDDDDNNATSQSPKNQVHPHPNPLSPPPPPAYTPPFHVPIATVTSAMTTTSATAAASPVNSRPPSALAPLRRLNPPPRLYKRPVDGSMSDIPSMELALLVYQHSARTIQDSIERHAREDQQQPYRPFMTASTAPTRSNSSNQFTFIDHVAAATATATPSNTISAAVATVNDYNTLHSPATAATAIDISGDPCPSSSPFLVDVASSSSSSDPTQTAIPHNTH